jgi:hypothetical protein
MPVRIPVENPIQLLHTDVAVPTKLYPPVRRMKTSHDAWEEVYTTFSP